MLRERREGAIEREASGDSEACISLFSGRFKLQSRRFLRPSVDGHGADLARLEARPSAVKYAPHGLQRRVVTMGPSAAAAGPVFVLSRRDLVALSSHSCSSSARELRYA